MRQTICSVLLIFFVAGFANAQKSASFKEHLRTAEKARTENNFYDVGFHSEAAWTFKPKRFDILKNAAEAYFSARDYAKAAELYQILLGDNKFSDSRLNYARALQQLGQYDEALPEFLQYSSTYNGLDREQILDKIENYVEGCTKGIVLTEQAKTNSSNPKLTHLNFNSSKNEINPFFFNDDILYFSVQTPHDTMILRSEFSNEDWTSPTEVPALRNLLPNRAILNGNFVNNGNDFYFSSSETIVKNKHTTKGIYLYHVQKTASGWSVAEKLGERINIEGGISTQPFVFKKYDQEWMFFASNRPGGRGGMDIWWTKRALNASPNDFDAPQNCGSIINTEGDEVTPFYDIKLGELYFSSNGRPTLGGLDIFKSKGFSNKWYAPENLGMPFNSSADDVNYVQSQDETQSYFVSNRMLGAEKLNTLDDDIYSVALSAETNYELKGIVQSAENRATLKIARVTLFEKLEKEKSRKLLVSTMCTDGIFNFTVFPNKQYVLEIEADSFIRQAQNIAINYDKMTYNIRVALERSKIPDVVVALPITDTPNIHFISTDSNLLVAQTSKSVPSKKQSVADKNINSKLSYRVQVLAYETPDYNSQRRLQRVEDMGEFDTERATVNGKTYTRVLLKQQNTYTEAVSVLKKVKSRALIDAFIVRYENGLRADR